MAIEEEMMRQTAIQSAVIYRCTDRLTQQVFYLVQSDSHPGMFYRICWDDRRALWICLCDSRHRPCKHVRAIKSVLLARRGMMEVGAELTGAPAQKR